MCGNIGATLGKGVAVLWQQHAPPDDSQRLPSVLKAGGRRALPASLGKWKGSLNVGGVSVLSNCSEYPLSPFLFYVLLFQMRRGNVSVTGYTMWFCFVLFFFRSCKLCEL